MQNRPLGSRRQVPVASIFAPPLHLLWQSKFEKFNHLQSQVSNALCHSDDNVVVSAPTGAGKTAIFEMAMARFIGTDLQNPRVDQNGLQRLSKNRKVVYIAPSKALCEERYEDWSRRLSMLHVGIEVAMITGDADPGNCYHDLKEAHFILTTPEKWDSLSRKWSENFFLLASVKLFMIDEVHLLGDKSRGWCLESIVSRMKSIQRAALQVDVSVDDLHSSR
jgi:ATP-dependent DNA helicase HFM1/MER3